MNALRKLISDSNQVECAHPLVPSTPHLLARVHQSYSIAAFILRILQVFGATDVTSVSQAWTAPTSPPTGINPISIEQVFTLATTQPVWVSMEAPQLKTFAAAFHGAIIACKLLAADVTAVASPGKGMPCIHYSCSHEPPKSQIS